MSKNPFLQYQQQVEQAMKNYLATLGPQKHLTRACEYALFSGGKRFRPSLVCMVASALKTPPESVIFSAMGLEFFHTASLVVDDLPAMDDDEVRRAQPSVHKKFGESIALLTSYSLIAAGYECIGKNVSQLRQSDLAFRERSERIGILALESATYNTGLNGATGGQYLDMAPPDLTLDTLKKIIQMKTTSLFEIAFVFGWLFGGGECSHLSQVKQAAKHFGLAFQIVDDLQDADKDRESGRLANVASVLGKQRAIELFHVEQSAFLEKLKQLRIDTEELQEVAYHLSDLRACSKSSIG